MRAVMAGNEARGWSVYSQGGRSRWVKMKPTDTHDSSACVESGLSILKLIHLSPVSFTYCASSSSPSFPFPSSPESTQSGLQYRGRSPGPVILCSTWLLCLACCLLCCLLAPLPRAILHSFVFIARSALYARGLAFIHLRFIEKSL